MRWIAGLLTLIALPTLRSEIVEWCPRLATRILRAAARRLPDGFQERYEEEWLAHLAELPGRLGGVALALSLYVRAPRISRVITGVALLSETGMIGQLGYLWKRSVTRFRYRLAGRIGKIAIAQRDLSFSFVAASDWQRLTYHASRVIVANRDGVSDYTIRYTWYGRANPALRVVGSEHKLSSVESGHSEYQTVARVVLGCPLRRGAATKVGYETEAEHTQAGEPITQPVIYHNVHTLQRELTLGIAYADGTPIGRVVCQESCGSVRRSATINVTESEFSWKMARPIPTARYSLMWEWPASAMEAWQSGRSAYDADS
jgi:hypothetical protein